MKHTDSIMKSIAVSGAIVLAGFGGYVFLNGPMTLPMAIGSICAIIATQNYTFDIDMPSSSNTEERQEGSTPLLRSKVRGPCADANDPEK